MSALVEFPHVGMQGRKVVHDHFVPEHVVDDLDHAVDDEVEEAGIESAVGSEFDIAGFFSWFYGFAFGRLPGSFGNESGSFELDGASRVLVA